MAAEETSHARLGALDGIRGLAVGAVVLYHSDLTFSRGGFLGVSAFFTLSGFLITSLLIGGTRDRGHVSLRGFWARRARRLLPAAAIALAGVLLFGATVATADQLRTLRGDVVAAIGYAANWRFYLSGQSYAGLFSSPSPVLHFWSLAIEEQFYVVFPLVVAAVSYLARGRRALLGGLLVAGITASVLASRALYATHGASRVYYGTDTRAAELLVGALLAVLVAGRVTPARPLRPATRALASAAGAAALGVMVWWWATVGQSAAWLYRGGLALHAVCTAVVIAAARADGLLARALAWRPLAGLGRISYGVYLYHWPIYLWLTHERTGLGPAALLGLRLAITLAIAIVSFVYVEQPILRGVRLRGSRPVIAIPATAAALVAGLVAVTASVPAPTVVFAPLSARPSTLATEPVAARAEHALARPRTPTRLYRSFTGSRPLRILVVGDSVGLTLGRGLELWAADTGAATVRNDAIQWCSLGRHLREQLPLGREQAPATSCADWGTVWPATIASFDPDVVVVMYSIWEIEPRQLPSGRWAQPGDPELDRWQLGEYRAAASILSARGAPVLWLDAACEQTAIGRHDTFWPLDYVTIPALAASTPAVHVVDMNHLLCPHGPPEPDFGGVHDVRPDGAHFSDAGALAVARWLMPIVLGRRPAPASVFPPRPRA